MKIDELKQLIDRVQRLLVDPHPGSVTWQMSLGESMTELVDKWNKPEAAETKAPADENPLVLTGTHVNGNFYAAMTHINERLPEFVEDIVTMHGPSPHHTLVVFRSRKDKIDKAKALGKM